MKGRDRSRTAAPSKMELFVIKVNGFEPLTIITKCSILDVAAILDPPLKGLSMVKMKSETSLSTLFQSLLVVLISRSSFQNIFKKLVQVSVLAVQFWSMLYAVMKTTLVKPGSAVSVDSIINCEKLID